MNAPWMEGRRLNTKLASGCLADMESKAHAEMARRGSKMLRDAILKAKGYRVPEPVSAPPAPVFKKRKVKPSRPRGKPKGWRKVRRHNPKIAEINALVAAHFKLTVEGLTSKNKSFDVAHPRQIAMYLARKRTHASLEDIGFEFGGKDHTTVRHAVIEVEKRIAASDQNTLLALNAVHAVIGA